MVLETPRLCNDVAFQPPQKDEPNGITCRPVLAPEEVENYEHNQKVYKSALQEAQIWEANPDAAAAFGVLGDIDEDGAPIKIVGDIVIGGHKIVPEDVEILKSGIVGGIKEKYVDTIANSWGKDLAVSKEDMKRLGLQDAKAIEKLEKLKKELKKQANGEGWRLDVVDTPHGREYRGIYGEGVEEEVTGDQEGKARAKAQAKAKVEPGKDKKTPQDGAAGGEVTQDTPSESTKEEQKEESEDSGGGERGSQEEYFHEEL